MHYLLFRGASEAVANMSSLVTGINATVAELSSTGEKHHEDNSGSNLGVILLVAGVGVVALVRILGYFCPAEKSITGPGVMPHFGRM